MRLKATHGPTYLHYHEPAHNIDPEHLSEEDPTHLQPYEWVHYLINWEQSATVAKSKAATPWASAMRDPSNSEWWQLKSPTKQKTDLGSTDIASQIIKHSVIRTWSSIHNKQITIDLES